MKGRIICLALLITLMLFTGCIDDASYEAGKALGYSDGVSSQRDEIKGLERQVKDKDNEIRDLDREIDRLQDVTKTCLDDLADFVTEFDDLDGKLDLCYDDINAMVQYRFTDLNTTITDKFNDLNLSIYDLNCDFNRDCNCS